MRNSTTDKPSKDSADMKLASPIKACTTPGETTFASSSIFSGYWCVEATATVIAASAVAVAAVAVVTAVDVAAVVIIVVALVGIVTVL